METKNETRLRGMLGFAMRAGKLLIGTDTIFAALSRKGGTDVKLVVMPCDASDGAKDKMIRRCTAHEVRYSVLDIPASELGRLLGKLYAPSAVAVTDDNFAKEIMRAQGIEQ